MAKKKQLKEKKKIPFVDGLKAKDIDEVSLEDIKETDTTFQYRFSSNLGDLKRSLTQEGQKEPIDLTGSKPYRVIDGFRRIEATRQLGWQSVKAIIHKGISEEQAHKLAFIKNVVRKNLSPMEKANAIHQARQRGMNMEELKEFFGLSEKQLKRYEELLNFPQEIQKLLEKGAITMGHAKVLSDFKINELDDWVKKISGDGYSVKQLKRELKKTSVQKSRGRAKLYFKKVVDGFRIYPFTITKDAPEKEREKVLKMLQEVIEMLKG